jgi:hypothetical protein
VSIVQRGDALTTAMIFQDGGASFSDRASGDDVGDQHILELADLVLDPQLALLDAGYLQLIDGRRGLQRDYRCFEVAMLLAQDVDAAFDQFTVQDDSLRNGNSLWGF